MTTTHVNGQTGSSLCSSSRIRAITLEFVCLRSKRPLGTKLKSASGHPVCQTRSLTRSKKKEELVRMLHPQTPAAQDSESDWNALHHQTPAAQEFDGNDVNPQRSSVSVVSATVHGVQDDSIHASIPATTSQHAGQSTAREIFDAIQGFPNTSNTHNDSKGLTLQAAGENLEDDSIQILPAIPISYQNESVIVADVVVGEDGILEQHLEEIRETRKRTKNNQLMQAERMLKRSRKEMTPAQENDTVAIPMPLVDRGRGDARNIMGFVLNKDQNEMYKIGVKAGVLRGRYSRNQFSVCQERFLSEEDIDTEKTVSLREAVAFESLGGGQGFIKCNCRGGKGKTCASNRCKCYKNKLKCNSRCHGSVTCPNK